MVEIEKGASATPDIFQDDWVYLKTKMDINEEKCQKFDERKSVLDTKLAAVEVALADLRQYMQQSLFSKESPEGFLTSKLCEYQICIELNK